MIDYGFQYVDALNWQCQEDLHQYSSPFFSRASQFELIENQRFKNNLKDEETDQQRGQ
jgi:hypothetical protein